jgi:hypothetical protein
VEEELHDGRAVIAELRLELVDLVIGPAPFRLLREALDPLDEDAAVRRWRGARSSSGPRRRWFIGKSDDLADIGLAGEQHDDAVDARAPSRRAAGRRT